MTDTHIIEAGDSNALGYLNEGPAPYVPTAQVQIWALQPDGTYQWNYMRPGINTGTPANPSDWGPEVSDANKWLAEPHGPNDYLWIVKDDQTVKGGTTLAVDWAQGGHMFQATTGAASAAMHNLDGSRFAFTHYDVANVVLGENDALVSSYAQAYQTNLAAFVTDARADWNVDNFVFSRINDAVGDPADNLAVRQAVYQVDVNDPHVTSFKTIGYAMAPDDLHYAADGQISLGAGFYDSYTGMQF